jgi:hypothetical protein
VVNRASSTDRRTEHSSALQHTLNNTLNNSPTLPITNRQAKIIKPLRSIPAFRNANLNLHILCAQERFRMLRQCPNSDTTTSRETCISRNNHLETLQLRQTLLPSSVPVALIAPYMHRQPDHIVAILVQITRAFENACELAEGRIAVVVLGVYALASNILRTTRAEKMH